MSENTTGSYELPEDEVNKAFIQLDLNEDGKTGDIRISGDAFVGQNIPALLTYTGSKLVKSAGDEAVLKALDDYEGKPWKLVIERTEGEEENEDGEREDTWSVTRGEDEEDKTVLGPILTFLAYLVENEQVARDIQAAGVDA